jgi:hypothetical protein
MGIRRAVVICSFGDRDFYLKTLLKSLRKYPAVGDIWLVTDESKGIEGVLEHVLRPDEIMWKEHPRWPIRNTNLFLAKFSLWEVYESVCCLNDDMYICSKGFLDGFCMAEKFGVCVPTNPRVYVKYNAMGADTTAEDRRETDKGPIYAPACNVSPMFVCRLHSHAKLLIEAYIDELRSCMRGTLAFWLASWRTGITPLYLPEQWCVCASNASHIKNYKKRLQEVMYSIEPIVLHWGQSGVREVFKDMVQ